MYKNRSNLITLITLVVVTSIVSFTISAFVFIGWNKLNPDSISFDTKVVSKENITKFNQVRDILKSQYYKGVDENIMLEGAIAGMAESLGDRYTAYYPKEKWQVFEQELEGSFVGIGVTVKMDSDGLLTIMDIYEDSPAQKSGVLPGDKVVKVDGTDVTKMEEDAIIKLIRGKEGTKVKITIFRESETRFVDIDITRQKIKEENIKSKLISNNIGYIKLVKFDSEIAKYFEKSLNKLIDKGIKGLIIDVRDNPGGYYRQVVDVADLLLPKCTIVYTEDKYRKKEFEYSDSNQIKLPIVVLVNGNSASASEILAGAIKDNKRGILVGTKTYGKGLVQASFTLDDGSGIKLTVQRYFTPSGVCIQGKGIEPNEVINLPEKYQNIPVSRIPAEEDTQLQKAIEMMRN
ncbi:MAG: S41 family peptidase [Clostridia bacterium]|nr:S41 family peptidase [Clostridia bacterium]